MQMIPLNQGAYAIVDDEDFEFLSQWNWFLSSQGYAFRNERHGQGRRTTIFMHRVVAKTPRRCFTDHINFNPLDNRRSNLRICTKRQNNFSRRVLAPKADTPYRGVYFRYGTRYHARLKCGGKAILLGTFDNAEDAARCYNEGARKYFGQFAVLNQLPA